jgi:hypothetical protein
MDRAALLNPGVIGAWLHRPGECYPRNRTSLCEVPSQTVVVLGVEPLLPQRQTRTRTDRNGSPTDYIANPLAAAAFHKLKYSINIRVFLCVADHESLAAAVLNSPQAHRSDQPSR